MLGGLIRSSLRINASGIAASLFSRPVAASMSIDVAGGKALRALWQTSSRNCRASKWAGEVSPHRAAGDRGSERILRAWRT